MKDRGVHRGEARKSIAPTNRSGRRTDALQRGRNFFRGFLVLLGDGDLMLYANQSKVKGQ